MKILISLHAYPPHHNAGGEMCTHNIAKYLVSKGHAVRVLVNESEKHGITIPYDIDGVEVWPRIKRIDILFHWCDSIITHLGWTHYTVGLAHVFHKPVFFVVHNTHFYPCVGDRARPVNVIYNCQAAKNILQYPQPNIVLPPPVDYRDFDLGQDPAHNKYITLINLNENKGGKILYQLARAMPERKFLAVKGSYDPQIIEDLPNVHHMDHTHDIKEVYRKTRILIMPSEYESWGMCATEAMSNGIPVICTPTFGLKENCGDAALYVGKEPAEAKKGSGDDAELPKVTGRDDIQAWVRQIRSLDNKKTYLHQSNLSRERARFHDPQKRYEELLAFVINPNDPKFIS